MATLKQVVDVLETLYPLRYAEQWDEPGLIVGDLRRDVRNIAFAAAPSMAVIGQAIAGGIDLLICHHPLVYRSVHAVSGLGFRCEIVRKLNLAGCALWVGHTNADASYRGVSMAAADAFGLSPEYDPAGTQLVVDPPRTGLSPQPMRNQVESPLRILVNNS